ncbi:MAG: polymerase sigma-54 factor RpoN, partial [Myxococcales bacterium]|nr:polymerase sigma-54 factor RpoN [Myxococcales bacterium]
AEDIVQDTLVRAYYELSQLRELPAMRTWLFRIAHRRALDHLRRHARDELVEEVPDLPADTVEPSEALAQHEAVQVAVSQFAELAPAQRACVALKDVLGYSLEECAEALELSIPAVKAALHRGRVQLRALAATEGEGPTRVASPVVARYAMLFNSRDWDGVRAMLVDDVKLEVVAREHRSGKPQVGNYFSNYAIAGDWLVAPAWLDGREVLAVRRSRGDAKPSYAIELTLRGDQIAAIRDFRHVPYFAIEARFIE